MVSSILVDTLNNPTRALKTLFDPSIEIETFPSTVSSHFAQVFESISAFEEIPILDVRHPPESHPPRALVRFRAMVQDTSPSPEMYLSKLKGGNCGGWGITEQDVNNENSNYAYADLQECTVVWAVTVPGESDWLLQQASGESDTKSHQSPQSHKFSVPGASHVGVQVKIYDNPDSLKATDLVTFVGILSSEPINSELDHDAPLEVPTLHVLFTRPHHLDDYHATGGPETDETPHAEIREELISWIADEALARDRDAAEWILLTCIARVQSRSPPILPPSLTIAHFPSPTVWLTPPPPTLSHILSLLLPLSTTIPLSLPLLNMAAFTPESKDEDLHAGYLQLPAGCTVLITESGVAEGKVIEKGLMNIKAIQDVITSQSLTYVFPFSSFSFPTDLGIVILAEGRKSAFFQTSITISLRKDAEKSINDLYKPLASITLPPVEKLAQFRQLMIAAKTGKVQVGEAASDHIQNDFVCERQNDKSVTADDLIMRMTVARLLALSLREPEVTIDIWERAKAMDGRRKERAS